MPKINCEYCGKIFEKAQKEINRTKHHYCSRKCCGLARRRPKINCEYCGKEFYPKDEEQKYCSHKCANQVIGKRFSGKDHPNYINGKSSYRDLAFKTYEHKCDICGWDKDERVLEVHHKDSNRNNNDIANLQIICPTCHRFFTLGIW